MNWNQYSDEDDEWLKDSDSQQQVTTPNKTQEQTLVKKQNAEQKNDNKNVQEKPGQKKPYERVKNNYEKKENKKYPTDKQLLESYESEKIEEKKRIKVINCRVQEENLMIKSLESDKKIKKLRTIKQNCYVITFWKKEDLIKFIKQKIDKNYKFLIGQYIINERERNFIAEKQKERTENKAKQDRDKQYKRREERQDRERDYKKKQQYRQKNEQQGKKKQHRKEKEQVRQDKKQYDKNKEKKKESSRQKRQNEGRNKQQRKNRQQAKNLQRQSKFSENIIVLSDEASTLDAVEWIKTNKITDQFNEFTLIAPGRLWEYIQKLCDQIYKSLKYGLVPQNNEEQFDQKPEETFKFKLQIGAVPKQKMRPAVYIKKVQEECFKNVLKHNTHIIGDKNELGKQVDFDQKEYIDLFKKNYQKIVGKWSQWIFFAYGNNISKLLRLSGVFKKQILPKNEFKYEVGVSNKLPFARFQICDLNKTKFKLDTSVINSHLQDQ